MKETDNAEKNQRRLGLAAFLVAGFVILMAMIGELKEGDTAATRASDLSRQSLPVQHAEFERQFPPGFWSEGPHEYTLSLDCPGHLNDLTATHSFQASATSTTEPGHVYLRLKGLLIRRDGPDAAVTQFNPAESSSALVILDLEPGEGAEQCTATIVLDGHLQSLIRTDFYNVDVDNDW